MTILATDPFTGTGDIDLSADWTSLTSGAQYTAPKLNGNEARNPSGVPGLAYFSGALVGGGSWPADQYCEIVVGSVVSTSSDEGVGPAVRVNGSGTAPLSMYFVQTNTNETKLYKWTSGAGYAQLGSDGAACASGNLLRVTISGTSLTVTKNGSTIIGPITDAAISGGSAGIWCSDVGGPGTINSFEGGDLLVGPTINTQPQSATVYQGQTANFTIAATAGAGALHYQWKDDGSNVGTDSNSYTTAATVLGDSGSLITCVVTDDNGNTTSQAAILTVIPTASIAWLRA